MKEFSNKLYDQFKLLAPNNQTLKLVDNDLHDNLKAFGLEIPKILSFTIPTNLSTIKNSNTKKKLEEKEDIENSFENLVKCTKDVYEGKTRELLRNPKNGRRVGYQQKKSLVEILKMKKCFINSDGDIIDSNINEHNQRIMKME